MKAFDFSKKMTYVRALGLPFRVAPYITIINMLNDIIQLFIAPASIFITAHFINTALTIFDDDFYMRSIILSLTVLVVFRIYGHVTEPLISMLNTHYGHKRWQIFDYPLIARRAEIDIKHFENSETNDVLTRVVNNSYLLHNYWSNSWALALNIGYIASYMIVLFLNVPLLAIALPLIMLPVILIGQKSGNMDYKYRQHITQYDRIVSAYEDYLSSRQAVAERNLFNFSSELTQRYHNTWKYIRRYTDKFSVKHRLLAKLTDITQWIAFVVALFLMIPHLMDGRINMGMYIALMEVSRSLYSRFRNITFDRVAEFQKSKAYMGEFNQHLELSRREESLSPMSDIPIPFIKMEIRNLTFSYPGTENVVLRDLNITIEKGKRYALVGANGSGKTTLIKLIMRMYEDYTGEILLNGKDIRDWPFSCIKATISSVFQHSARYDISLSDNIAIGAGLKADAEDIDKAIKDIGLTDAITKLDKGKDTLLGKIHDGAVELSDGQWQKIAIARVLVSSAPIKILDEPTAALDPLAERDVYAMFDKASRGFTTLFISHRMASTKMADEIIVMDKGMIVEQGSYMKLMDQGGLYAKMFKSQGGWYA